MITQKTESVRAHDTNARKAAEAHKALDGLFADVCRRGITGEFVLKVTVKDGFLQGFRGVVESGIHES